MTVSQTSKQITHHNTKTEYPTFESYINTFPDDVKNKLFELREIISSILPEAKEVFSYGIPTYDINGHVVHFAGYKNHIGFYPTPSGIKEFRDQLTPYKYTKGTIQFPINQPLPKELIMKIVKFRKLEDSSKDA